MAIDYKSAGVDVEAGDQLVDWLESETTPARRGPHPGQLISGIGGFAAIFKPALSHLKNPCFVSCTDGVGTKVKLASYFDHYEGVGQDLVAMCVNDLICTGAEPLFFLDYFASSRLEQHQARAFLEGVRRACDATNCLLIGGETAEMPGVYQPKDFDCAGFSVGVVDEDRILGPLRVRAGDQIVGVHSSGFHSNGFSLLRRLFADDLSLFRAWLLEPTALYVEPALRALRATEVHAIAHITGGGIENLPRVLPEELRARLRHWAWSDAYLEVEKRAGLSRDEMLRTFNCGMGLMVICPPQSVDTVIKNFAGFNQVAEVIGEVEDGPRGVVF